MLMHRLLECINSHRVSWCNRYKSRWSNLISPLYRKLPKMSVIFPWDTIAGCPQKHQMWLQSVIKKYIEINEETLPREDQTTFDSLALQTKIFSWKRQYKFGTFFCAPSSICKLYAFNSWSQQMCIGYTTLLWQCGFNGPVINELTYLLTYLLWRRIRGIKYSGPVFVTVIFLLWLWCGPQKWFELKDSYTEKWICYIKWLRVESRIVIISFVDRTHYSNCAVVSTAHRYARCR